MICIDHSTNEMYVIHGGPGSGRYPLGSGDRPYQMLETSKITKSSKKPGLLKATTLQKTSSGGSSKKPGILKTVALKSQEKKKTKLLKAYRKQQEEQEAAEQAAREAYEKKMAAKSKVLTSGTARQVSQYKGMMSNSELKAATERLKMERELDSYSADEVKQAMKKASSIFSAVKDVTSWADTSIDAYNMMAAVYNATPYGSEQPWTYIDPKNHRRLSNTPKVKS